MQMLTVTLGSGTRTPIVPQDQVVQRNATYQTLVIGSTGHIIYVGDSTVAVSGTVGIPIAANGAPLVIPTASLTQNLNGWYIAGTSGDVVTVLLLE